MLRTMLWLAGSYGFYRYMMERCRKAAREGYEEQLRSLRAGRRAS